MEIKITENMLVIFVKKPTGDLAIGARLIFMIFVSFV